MAIIKHIKSRNANYSDALEYLLFQHNEKTGKPIFDDSGRKILREEFYMDGLNCDPMSFDKECERTNQFFHKNQKRGDIKSHHYIISFDPADATECGLTGEKAQALCLEFARKNFPGYQALVVTHTDGHNSSGNIHTHIVINSVRKYAVERQDYMDKPHEQEAGYKHRSTNKLLDHLKQEVMDMCNREGLHQVDLLSPAPAKMTRGEYWAKTHGQDELDKVNAKIRAAGLKPASTVFQTQKQFLREAIDECSQMSRSFEEFQSLLLDRFNISVVEKRGSYRYLHPDRDRRISAESLGANYEKDFLEQVFQNHENSKALSHKSTLKSKSASSVDYHTDPFVIFYIKSELRLVTDLQTNVKAMQNQAYARKVKISNLQQMANTLIYIQDHGYDTRKDLEKQTTDIQVKMEEAQEQLSDLTSKMKTLNSQIHFTGQYFASKSVYAEFLKSRNKKKFRQEHSSEIRSYEEARDWLKAFYPDGKMLSMKTLKSQKSELQESIDAQKSVVKQFRDYHKELEIAGANVDAILGMEEPFVHNSHEQPAQTEKSKTNTQHKKKEDKTL
ncbi:relaxase/mobilization nuclease domain-containing protein [Faecalicatena contorta]|uniref:relaxase/mobilization nuclease domain-containing protein n=1 Tax=Faecalicatena contorta TaxID=39482 RepID=UPI001F19468B|nr:relaxase/mobilization nuclease domain-containing protein [Faecalicatena contorta]MCF2668331.1 relaxase/mobilization nuclease domain-containing protein [Faecalicatena contorta]